MRLVYRSLIAVVLVALAWSANLNAQMGAPNAPVEFSGKVISNSNEQYVKLYWMASRDGSEATSFNVYMAVGETEDETKFDKIGSVEVKPNTASYYFQKTGLKAGVYTFYVKAENSDGESVKTKVAVLEVKEGSTEKKVVFVSTPVKTGKESETYRYQAKVEKNVEGTVEFKLAKGPDGMTIDSKSGIVTWEKAVKGRYEIKITATVIVDGKEITAVQEYVLEIGEGKDNNEKACITVYGTVKYDNTNANEGVNYGTVLAFKEVTVKKEDGTTKTDYVSVAKAKVQNGSYSFTLEPGTYKFRVEGETFVAEWSEDAAEMGDAEVHKLTCDDPRVEVNFNVSAKPEPVKVVVSGQVTDADGKGMKAVVIFESTGKESKNATIRRVAVETDADGNYEAKLESGVSYIAFAKAGGDNQKKYAVEFWEETSDGTAATVLTLTEDTEGIDFTLELLPVNDNGIAGKLTSEKTGDALTGKVTAYQLKDANNPKGETSKHMVQTVETNANGEFYFTNLAAGKYILFASPSERPNVPGWYVDGEAASEKWSKATVIEIGTDTKVDGIKIQLVSAKGKVGNGKVRGWVYDKRGGIVKKSDGVVQENTSISGALIIARNEAGEIVDFTTSENEGAYLLTDLATGVSTLTIDRFEYETVVMTVTVMDENVEVQSSIGLLKQVSSVEIPTSEIGKSVNLYPNPTNATSTLRFVAQSTTTNVKVLSTSGVVVMTNTVENGLGQVSMQVDGASLPAGMYLVQVANGNTVFALPLSIVK